ncbi:MAG: IS110 family transposase [Candidatus Eisenbacteria bacterium]|uniref:IS110 family transposase n=1 Tax=Eiseniibacteriota bacterium TaxID=2212470 RepID=A0A9D6L8H7_UNCEI|nr:IS110 family transposase [Candidatus Eisenbacteria bacterium]
MTQRMVSVGLDVHKETITVAVAHHDPPAQVEELGTLPNHPEPIRRLMQKLSARYAVRSCYEAGPCGYAIYRQLRSLGVDCTVVAPSLVPLRPGDRVKTDRRDAVKLARLFRSGELTPVWVPDPAHEALRNLTRLRAAAHHDLTRARHRLSKFLLRSGCVPPSEAKPWTQRFLAWTRAVPLAQPLDTRVRDDYFNQVEHLGQRIVALDQVIADAAATSPMARRIAALCTMRGVSTITATTLVAEWGEIGRFTGPKQLMGYAGLVPSENSSGATTQRGRITKTGSGYLRRVLVEAAFAYRHRPLLGGALRRRQLGQPETVKRIAWKAQQRLHRLYSRLLARDKRHQKIVVAVAREMVGFLWAIDREMANSVRPA